MGNIIIISAPSGSGKSTIIKHLLTLPYNFAFSISATSRAPRGNEQNGVEYHFLSTEEFQENIRQNNFIEYEEVYPGCFYGTLKSEVENARKRNQILIFDVDVKGGINIKKIYGDEAISIFVQPPSIDELRRRLQNRATDSAEMIEKRVAKAAEELTYAQKFDKVIVNDDLLQAQHELETIINDFLAKP